MKDITFYLKEPKQLVDRHLMTLIENVHAPNVLLEAMQYSLSAGGKRIRPILLLATLEAFGENKEKGLDVACAIEMLHTYSLIHDDLPAMDNDDLRRGKPTNHKVFGEANAILAGDALLTYSFEVIAAMNEHDVTPEMKIELIKRFAEATGPEGMVAGQVEDLRNENNPNLTLQELENIHYNKTGKLIIFSIIAGAILAKASEEKINLLEKFAYHLGIAFQIQDDILDVIGDSKKTGKPTGSDSSKDKSTYPKLLTLEGAKQKLSEHLEQALFFLKKANIRDEMLKGIALYIINREN